MADIVVQAEPFNAFAQTVGTSVVTLLDEKTTSRRSVLSITNTSTLNQVITIGIGYQAVAGSGIVLYQGQTWTESPSEGFRTTNARITVVASAASGSVAVYTRDYPAGGG